MPTAVTAICRRLDGIPLALELASARLNVLTAEQIAARLDHLFALLPPAVHLTDSHHDTLHAAIEWSHDSLSEARANPAAAVVGLCRGLFAGHGRILCARERALRRKQLLELLSSLVNKSLVLAETQSSATRLATGC
jgi:predicted ATPase